MVWLAQPRARPRVGAEKQFTLLAEKQLLGGQKGSCTGCGMDYEWIIATPETQDSEVSETTIHDLIWFYYGFTLFS